MPCARTLDGRLEPSLGPAPQRQQCQAGHHADVQTRRDIEVQCRDKDLIDGRCRATDENGRQARSL